MQGFRNYNIEMMQREQLVDMMPSHYGKSISPPLSPNSGKLTSSHLIISSAPKMPED